MILVEDKFTLVYSLPWNVIMIVFVVGKMDMVMHPMGIGYNWVEIFVGEIRADAAAIAGKKHSNVDGPRIVTEYQQKLCQVTWHEYCDLFLYLFSLSNWCYVTILTFSLPSFLLIIVV